MLILNKIKFFIKSNFKKNYLLVFISVFTFIAALGTFYSIYNSADSNPKLVWFFLLLVLFSFFMLFISISAEILKLIKNIRLKAAGSILQKRIVAVFATVAIIPVLIVAIFAVIFFTSYTRYNT